MIELKVFFDHLSSPEPVDVHELVDPDEFDLAWERLYEQAMTLFEDCHYPGEEIFIDELLEQREDIDLLSVWATINSPWREADEHAYGDSPRLYPHSFLHAFRNALRGAVVMIDDDNRVKVTRLVLERTGKTPEQLMEAIKLINSNWPP